MSESKPLPKSKLVCRHCWIPVEPIPEPKRQIGRGNDQYNFKHKSLRDDMGNPYCGKTLLSREEVSYVKPIEEEEFKKWMEDTVL